jgi:hypothetical protein
VELPFTFFEQLTYDISYLSRKYSVIKIKHSCKIHLVLLYLKLMFLAIIFIHFLKE